MQKSATMDSKDWKNPPNAQDVQDYITATKNDPFNKSEARLLHKLKSLDKNLLESKQSVVRHIIQARLIETTKNQSIAIDKDLVEHIRDRLLIDFDGKYVKYLAHLNAGKFSSPLNDESFDMIERSARGRVPNGLGRIIHNALTLYSDAKFVSALNSFAVKPSRVNEAFFFKIVGAASNSKITYRDAHNLYIKAQYVLEHHGSKRIFESAGDATQDERKWLVLKSLLRKKLFALHLSEITMSALDSMRPDLNTLAPSRPATATAPSSPQHNSPTSRSAKAAEFNNSSNNNNNSNSNSNNNDNNQTSSAQKLLNVKQLKQLLDASNTSELDIKGMISDTMTTVSTSKDITLEALRVNPSALMYARKVYLEKLEVIYQRLNYKVKVRVWDSWKRIVRSDRGESISKAFVQYYGGYQLLNMLEFNVAKVIFRAMTKYKRLVERMRNSEGLAAILEIQRVWRGKIAKVHVGKVRKAHSILVIQKSIRSHFARVKVADLRHQKAMKASVLLIEALWIKNSFKRAMKKVFNYNKRMRKSLVIQGIFRGFRGRMRVYELHLRRRRMLAATKFQCLIRRYYATLRVDVLRHHRDRRLAAIQIQRIFRGVIARIAYKEMVAINNLVRKVQRAWLAFVARRERKRRYELLCLILVQRVLRGMKGRKRFKYLLARRKHYLANRHISLATIQPVLLGFMTRRRLKPVIYFYVRKRAAAASKIKMLFTAVRIGNAARRRCKILRDTRDRLIIQNKSALIIQRRQRGMRGRKKALAVKKAFELAERYRKAEKIYYKLKNTYFKDQSYWHKAKVTKIQCAQRQKVARRVAHERKLNRAATVIQGLYRLFMLKKRMLAAIERAKLMKSSIITIQAVIRGFLVRNLIFINKQGDLLQWFLRKWHSKSVCSKALANFRVMKAEEVKQYKAASVFQAVVRCRQKMLWYKRNLKKLSRQRNTRLKERRDKAATLIQTVVFRGTLAKMRVKKQRKIVEERERERLEWEDIERSLDGMHGEWLIELAAIKLETGGRRIIAKKEFERRLAESKGSFARKEKLRLDTAVMQIQKWQRGIQRRQWFKGELPHLKKAKRMRMFCVECTTRAATKKCRQCKDKFCVECYALMHRTGKRKEHNFVNVTPEQDTQQSNNDNAKGKKKKGGGGADAAAAGSGSKKASKKDWEEFYDAEAKAKYWFNKSTGEAAWIKPY